MQVVAGNFQQHKVKDEDGYPTRPLIEILEETLIKHEIKTDAIGHFLFLYDLKDNKDNPNEELLMTSTYTPLELNMVLDIIKKSIVEEGFQ